ncbi:hypothetical protein HDU67_002272 [Dinochytrium kinnereticum]|nr:hypothetical protein HDU67_002272 [Dinochytrium kinnereticum]
MQAVGVGPWLMLSYDSKEKVVKTVSPTPVQSTWLAPTVKKQYLKTLDKAIEDCNTNRSPTIHRDRILYAFASKVFDPKLPRPFGGKRNPGFLRFEGDNTDDLLNFIFNEVLQSQPHSRGKGKVCGAELLKLVIAGFNIVLRLHHGNSKDELDDSVMRGMRRSKLEADPVGKRYVLPRHLRDVKADVSDLATTTKSSATSTPLIKPQQTHVEEIPMPSKAQGHQESNSPHAPQQPFCKPTNQWGHFQHYLQHPSYPTYREHLLGQIPDGSTWNYPSISPRTQHYKYLSNPHNTTSNYHLPSYSHDTYRNEPLWTLPPSIATYNIQPPSPSSDGSQPPHTNSSTKRKRGSETCNSDPPPALVDNKRHKLWASTPDSACGTDSTGHSTSSRHSGQEELQRVSLPSFSNLRAYAERSNMMV